MILLNEHEISLVSGGDDLAPGEDIFGDISAGLGAAAAVAGGLAAVPTPATPALAAFGVVTGVLSAGAAYLSSHTTH
jgi:hypothetical protein